MDPYTWTHFSDNSVERKLADQSSQHSGSAAILVSLVADVDRRKLFLPAGHSSMHSYCRRVLNWSEGSAFKRIRVARAARKFPVLYRVLADNCVHLSGLVILAPHLTPENIDELIAAATKKSKRQIEKIVAERFPEPDLPTVIHVTPSRAALCELDESKAAPSAMQELPNLMEPLSPGTVVPAAAASVPAPSTTHARPVSPPASQRPKIAPLSPGRVGIQFTMSESTHEKLRYVQALLGHAVPSGDVAEVFDRALDALIARLEKQKFAAASRTRPSRSAAKGRYVPAEIRREVWQRDGGQCTFVSTHGARCEARTRLEFDHVEEFARGGATTTGQIRLRCQPHNQYTAELTYGAEFMRAKRENPRNASQANVVVQVPAATDGCRVTHSSGSTP